MRRYIGKSRLYFPAVWISVSGPFGLLVQTSISNLLCSQPLVAFSLVYSLGCNLTVVTNKAVELLKMSQNEVHVYFANLSPPPARHCLDKTEALNAINPLPQGFYYFQVTFQERLFCRFFTLHSKASDFPAILELNPCVWCSKPPITCLCEGISNIIKISESPIVDV